MPKCPASGSAGACCWRAVAPAVAADADKRRADALALAAKIDQHLDKAWADNKIVAAPPLDDGAFLRRVYLHLAGRIPSVSEARRSSTTRPPTSALRNVEELLAGQPLPAAHGQRLAGRAAARGGRGRPSARLRRSPLEAWLRSRLRADVGWDKIGARTADGYAQQPANQQARAGHLRLRPRRRHLAARAFTRRSRYKPENLAEVTARTFMGVRLGCAQCHNHPTADWKREQFWEYAAFFAADAAAAPQPATRPGRGDQAAAARDENPRRQEAYRQGEVPRRQGAGLEG